MQDRSMTRLMWLLAAGCLAAPLGAAEPAELTSRWTTLHRATRGGTQPKPLPTRGAIQPLGDLQFTGPMPAHPFVLGNFAVDGRFAVVNGGLALAEGRNAAIRLHPRADQFELEGRIAMKDYGGWFLLVGWDEKLGNGYALHNCTMKESGAPWFITELRERSAVEGTTQELRQYEWKQAQDVRVTVRERQLAVQLGPVKVLEDVPLPSYQPGAIVFGVYDTRYGPRPVLIESLRIRAAE